MDSYKKMDWIIRGMVVGLMVLIITILIIAFQQSTLPVQQSIITVNVGKEFYAGLPQGGYHLYIVYSGIVDGSFVFLPYGYDNTPLYFENKGASTPITIEDRTFTVLSVNSGSSITIQGYLYLK